MAVNPLKTQPRMKLQPEKQAGAALILALIMLLALTVLTLSGSSVALLESRMANNLRFKQQAREAAEWALREAEQQLNSNISLKQHLQRFDPTSASYISGSGYASPFAKPGVGELNFDITDPDRRVWANAPAPVPAFVTSPVTARYVVEYIGRVGLPPADFDDEDRRLYAFRVTALGYGSDNRATYLLQSTFTRELF